MHFNFDFSAVQVLWTLTFAAIVVLLVVLLGRDRGHRFPWYTASIVMVALRLLSNRLLHDRLPELTMAAVFIVMADISALLGILVVAEIARLAFRRVGRKAWLVWGLVLLLIGASVLAKWGVWPAWKTIAFDTPMAKLGLLQLMAQKTGLLVDVLNVSLGLLIVAFGRRYGAGWRSHVQQIVIGLSTASISQMAAQGIWQIIVHTAAQPHSEAEYMRVLGLRDKLFNANSAVFVAVVIWWIVCLWNDEPGLAPLAEVPGPVGAGLPEGEDSAVIRLSEDTEE